MDLYNEDQPHIGAGIVEFTSSAAKATADLTGNVVSRLNPTHLAAQATVGVTRTALNAVSETSMNISEGVAAAAPLQSAMKNIDNQMWSRQFINAPSRPEDAGNDRLSLAPLAKYNFNYILDDEFKSQVISGSSNVYKLRSFRIVSVQRSYYGSANND